MTKQLNKRHFIQQQTIEINFSAITDGLGLKHRITELYYEELLPQIELLFNELADDQHVISFENLTIDCGVLSYKHWEDEWVAETVRGLKRELLAAHKIKREKAAEDDKLSDHFFFFLQTGRLPWNSSITSLSELEQIVPDLVFIRKLKAIVQEEPKAADRLVYRFSEELVRLIIEFLAEEKAATDRVGESKKREVYQKSILAGLIKRLCMEQQEGIEPLEETSKDVSIKENTKEIKKEAVTSEYIYVHNAGMVLLHPFLEELFRTLGLITEQYWSNELSAHTAAMVLEYLISGSDECPECYLSLNKIMCGLEIDEVLITAAPLSAEIKKECDDMLQVIIQHWSALKNTGIEALRETFLQRSGKLSALENGWLLQVEQKTVDILLGQLPWGFGVIKLPWQENLVYVEWV